MTKTTGTPGAKLSWRETYKAMAAAKEDWSDLEATTADGFRSSAQARRRCTGNSSRQWPWPG